MAEGLRQNMQVPGFFPRALLLGCGFCFSVDRKCFPPMPESSLPPTLPSLVFLLVRSGESWELQSTVI